MSKKVNFFNDGLNALLIFLMLCLSQNAYALSEPSLGQAAHNMLVPLGIFTEVFYKICYIIGGMLIVGSGIQYKNYRDNPSAVRLSTPIVLFLLGLALALLPIISSYSPGAGAAVSAISE